MNCTIAGGAGTFNSGIASAAGSTVNLQNTILAGAGNQCKTAGGTITSQGHNLSTDASCGLTGPGDIQGLSPLLQGLANNGGPTPTMLLSACSPAINGGDSSAPGIGSFDQREAGFPRILFGTVDIGATEYSGAMNPCITTQPVGQTVFAGQALTLSVVASPYPPSPTYQWRQNGGNIPGATSAT